MDFKEEVVIEDLYTDEYYDNIILALKRAGHRYPEQIVNDLAREKFRIISFEDFDQMFSHTMMSMLRNGEF